MVLCHTDSSLSPIIPPDRDRHVDFLWSLYCPIVYCECGLLVKVIAQLARQNSWLDLIINKDAYIVPVHLHIVI